MKNKHTSIFLLLFLVIVAASIFTVIFADNTIISVISTISTLLGILGLLYSFKLDRNISEASFLFDLYNTFRGNEKIGELSQKLEKVFLGETTEITNDDRSNIVEYLTFFEVLASMEGRGVISISSFDALFGYDFFIAVNNDDVKSIELIPYAAYYSETIRLEKKWRIYRKRHKFPIPLETPENSK